MNTTYGYQLFQAERTPSRSDMLAVQAQAGQRAAAVMQAARWMAGVLTGRRA